MIKSHSVISEQENYHEYVDEFPRPIPIKNKSKKGEVPAEEESQNPCDETIGYVQILDEFENIDKFKKLPRQFEYNCNKGEIEQNLILNIHDNTLYNLEIEQAIHSKNKGQKVTLPKFQIRISPFQKSDEFFANGEKSAKNRNGNHDKSNNYLNTGFLQIQQNEGMNELDEESDNEENIENEIINQFVIQIPELLDKSEMKDDYGLTPSLVDGLKQHSLADQKSQFSKFKQQGENIKDEEEQAAIFENRIDAKSQIINESDHDLLQRQLTEQRQAQIQREEQEKEEKLMEGYETDPPIPPQDENVIYTLMKKEFSYHNKKISKQMIFDLIKSFKFIQAKDECRAEVSHKEGGKECKDKKIKECLRAIGKEIISQVGRKILSGSLNLTQISFPIRAMIPKSALEKALYSTSLFPLYINKAAQTSNLVERFKFLICATFGNFYINCGFLKPLNPILGETCIGIYPDGTKLYTEQISHHPPISYLTIYGPDKSYLMYGNYNYESNAGLNSLKLKNRGSRHIKFKDGQQISYNFAKEVYSGSFMGAMKVESKGQILFKDEVNKITAEVAIDSVKKRPTDYLSGTIKINDQVVSKVYGTYMGFIEFDDVRYWDFRYVLPYEPIILKSPLGSDQSKRKDKYYLIQGDIINAQKYKEEYEDLQRNDAKMRKKYSEQKASSKKKK